MLQYRQCKIDYRKDNKKEIQKKLAAKLHIRPEEITDLQIVKEHRCEEETGYFLQLYGCIFRQKRR